MKIVARWRPGWFSVGCPTFVIVLVGCGNDPRVERRFRGCRSPRVLGGVGAGQWAWWAPC